MWAIEKLFVAVLMILLPLSLLHSPGTSDIKIWQQWLGNVDTSGIVKGFAANQGDYPPFTAVILFFTARLAHLFSLDTFTALKLSIVGALFLTSFVFWLWTRDFVATAVLHFSLILNSVALVYTDIYFAPGLIAALWALKQQKLALSTILFMLCCLTKWQPALIAPFVLLYMLKVKELRAWRRLEYKNLARSVLFPAVMILVPVSLLFGDALLQAAKEALSHVALSGNALNLNWVLTYGLHVLLPQKFGGLVEGRAARIDTVLPQVVLVPRLLFLLFYTSSIVVFLKRDKTFANLIYFSLLGYLAFFTLNTGVHENHLFLAMILAVVLFSLDRRYLPLAAILIFANNINLLLFYGLNGKGLRFSYVVGIDFSLLFAIVNVLFFLFLWIATILDGRSPRESSVLPSPPSRCVQS